MIQDSVYVRVSGRMLVRLFGDVEVSVPYSVAWVASSTSATPNDMQMIETAMGGAVRDAMREALAKMKGIRLPYEEGQ